MLLLMNMLRKILANTLSYLWSGFGSIASILLLCALWELGAQTYGDLVLPGPITTFNQLQILLQEQQFINQVIISTKRTFLGLALALVIGTSLGLVAGIFTTIAVILRPIITLLLGMPPIAWLVLAMIWFGLGQITPIFTVFIACVPIVFIGAMQGTRMLDDKLLNVARAYKLPKLMLLTDIYLPHMISYLFPAWITALGTSWKVIIMAELLTTSDGIGAELAISRAQLDTANSLAQISLILLLLLATEYLILEPIKRYVEKWRTS